MNLAFSGLEFLPTSEESSACRGLHEASLVSVSVDHQVDNGQRSCISIFSILRCVSTMWAANPRCPPWWRWSWLSLSCFSPLSLLATWDSSPCSCHPWNLIYSGPFKLFTIPSAFNTESVLLVYNSTQRGSMKRMHKLSHFCDLTC